MSKRTDTIKNLFTAPQTIPLSVDNNRPSMPPRVSSGAVRSLRTLSRTLKKRIKYSGKSSLRARRSSRLTQLSLIPHRFLIASAKTTRLRSRF